MADSLHDSLNTLSVYPNGSYTANISEFTKVNYSFLPLNQTLLNQLIRIDKTSFIFEAGREQFLYFRISAFIINLSGMGIHFGDTTDKLNIIPVGAQQQNPPGVGIIPTNLPDGSSLVRIRIVPAVTMCSQAQISDSCIDIKYRAYLVLGKNQLSATPVINRANAACGDVCSSLNAYSACSASCGSQCDGNQVSGADTPVSRRYNLNRKFAEFQFNYQTYYIRDQIRIWNGLKLLFNSGCVGTRGVRNASLTLSDDVNIRVDVEPNCACQRITGCRGTAWHFTVVCPDLFSSKHQKVNAENDIKLRSNGVLISNGMISYSTSQKSSAPSILS